MKEGQTSIRNGIEDILIPMENFNCTQGDFEGNHPYYACDMAGKDIGQEPAYFPFSAQCVAMNPEDGNAVWWQSIKPVRFADGTIAICTMMILHDNDMHGIYIGACYAQGEQMAMEGNKMGNVNGVIGNHLHMEFAKGAFHKMYDVNRDGGYYLPGGLPIEQCCFADQTNFITGGNWDWKYVGDLVAEDSLPEAFDNDKIVNEKPEDFENQLGTFLCQSTVPIVIRRAPSMNGLDTGYEYAAGMSVRYDGFVRREGYVFISWISGHTGNRHWMACGETDGNGINIHPWGTFI